MIRCPRDTVGSAAAASVQMMGNKGNAFALDFWKKRLDRELGSWLELPVQPPGGASKTAGVARDEGCFTAGMQAGAVRKINQMHPAEVIEGFEALEIPHQVAFPIAKSQKG